MRRERGFTLLEIIVALAIFAFVAGAAMQTMANADYMAGSGRRARELRMLAERKLGEILTFERYYDDSPTLDGDLGSEYSAEYGERFRDWKWQLEIRDVTVFGIAQQEDAQYLFGAPTDEEKAAAAAPAQGAGSQPGQPAKKGETQQLRELTLRVSAPTDEGVADSVEVIAFAPTVPRKAAGGAPAK